MNDFATSPANACPNRETLSSFSVGQLPDDALDAISHHIETCTKCLETLDTLFQQQTHQGIEANVRLVLQTPAKPVRRSPAAVHAATASLAPTSLSAPAGPEAHPLLGTYIGPYLVVGVLGQGGMGIVFKAQLRDTETENTFALKMLNNTLAPTPETLQRFRNEINALAELNNPNIVRFHHAGTHAGQPYYVMEYVGRRNLARRLRGGPLSLEGAAMMVWYLANAVKDCHHAGIVHRDLKPANVLLTSDGKPKIADFGLARLLDRDDNPTQTDAVLGTAAYMSPEQARGESKYAFEKADIYALGAILYEALTGRAPFRGPTKLDILQKVIRDTPVPPSEYDDRIPIELEAICLKCLAKKPHHRYATADLLAADLTQWLDSKKSTATPPAWVRLWKKTKRALIPLGLVLGAVMLSGGLYLSDPTRTTDNIHRQLKNGDEVKLLTPEAPKLPYRIRSGGPSPKITVNADGSLTVNSWESVTLIEILPAMPTDRFTFEATIMHTNSKDSGFVGLYAAHTQAPNDTLEGINAYVGLAYNDIVSAREVAERADPKNAAAMPRPTLNNVGLGLGITGLCRDGTRWETYPRTIAGAPFVPAGIQGNAWHTLRLSISPDEIMGQRDGIPLKRYTPQKWLNTLQSQITAQQNRCPDDPHVQAMKPQFRPQAGIGIVIFQSNATIKQAVVRPDPAPDNLEPNAN